MRPTVDKVESSIKGGVKAKLGRKTLILGANGLGKSAIVNAVELAGTGRASDVAGRSTLAKDADLFMLAPPGKDHVSARAYLSEGAGTAAWELRKGHRAKRTGPEVHFPLRDVQEALLGSAETARKWVLQHGTPFSWSDVIMLVPLSLQPKLASLGRGPDPASSLTTALERARTEVRTANASAKTLRSLSSPSQPPPDPVFIAELEGIISAWQLRGNAAGPDDSAVQILKEALETRRTQISSLEGRVNEIEAKLASLPKPQGNFEVLRSAITVVETIAAGHFAPRPGPRRGLGGGPRQAPWPPRHCGRLGGESEVRRARPRRGVRWPRVEPARRCVVEGPRRPGREGPRRVRLEGAALPPDIGRLRGGTPRR